RAKPRAEALPGAGDPGSARAATSRDKADAAADAARKLGLEPRMIELKPEQGYAGAFAVMDEGQPLIVPAGPIFLRDRTAIAQVLLGRRIPSVAAFRENMEAGALVSY